MKLLNGVVEEVDERDLRIQSLEDHVEELTRNLHAANKETQQAIRNSARAVAELRRQLTPLYRALQAVFGELDDIGGVDNTQSSFASNPRTAAVWESWKSKLGVGPAKVIDALLLHGEMNTAQLAIATGYHRNTVPQYVSACNRAGLIVKNGGRFSLKSLT